ncbi:thioredoxin-like protein AAED1, chloroplastic [Selaginella moellendorffii]|uniref:thioredoxin-like protein AAED1, chloroplastic n=1 Tax=Selaginella moellendorffii TaxID=88036 RepID=UPI000D1C221C|nr:thioredoxin-like protein AAED1, chloroplastic [Selaginella moellendorffii]|eukprot:XP_024537757.1 thioredoxin-like protein AAED1, chloroplastic [Selaginella moellendorffii]
MTSVCRFYSFFLSDHQHRRRWRILSYALTIDAFLQEVFDAAGVSLVLVGPGTVDQAKAFVSQTQFPGEVYADPTHASFEAFQFVSGASTIFNPNAAMRVMGAHLEGYRQDWRLSFEKDTVQRGGW